MGDKAGKGFSGAAGLLGENTWQAPGHDFDDLSLAEHSNLIELDRRLHECWQLGRNFVLGWTAYEQGALLLVVPHYAIANYALAIRDKNPGKPASQDVRESERFVTELLSRKRQMPTRQIQNAARLLGVEPTYVKLRRPLSETQAETDRIERLVCRYGVSYAPNRAVALFDIVGFSLLSPFEQMTQLNSLSHSLNSAHSKMLDRDIDIPFARSTAGDGFYIWNRDLGTAANTSLYHLMHLVLADNAIARRKAMGRTVPLLRACFHVGSCYEFHQAEGLNPTISHDIVGDVTIELARMIERALPGQILVGDFHASDAIDQPGAIEMGAIAFIDHAQVILSQLSGLELSGEAIESIKCYLTGRAQDDGTYSVRRLTIQDKHGLSRNVFNAKINIYRHHADPILLGIEDKALRGDTLDMMTSAHILATRH